jgi:hypothetical protein
MKHSRQLRALGAVIAVAGLALPAAASAHPTVYTGEAVIDLDPDPGEFTAGTQARYTVTNHNNTFVLRETNGVDTDDHRGVMSYALLPADRRAILDQTEELATSTGAQAHHTCDVPALTAESAVLGWQDGDPFYNYVPFQKVRAGEQDPQFATQVRGLDDTPSNWIGDVQTLTGVDLTQVSDDPTEAATQLEALCEALPGATQDSFVPADRIQTSARALQLAMLEPLEEEVGELNSAVAAANQAKTAAERARDAAQGALAAANAQLATVMPQLRTFEITLPTANAKARSVASNGTTVQLAGPPLRAATVRLTIPQARAGKLGLRSGLLARATATIGADGTAEVLLKPKRSVASKLRRLRGTVRVTVDAVAGDRAAAARGLLTR